MENLEANMEPDTKISEHAAFPADLLKDPHPPNLSIERIDFSKTPLPEHAGRYAVVLDGVLTDDECVALTQAAEAHTGGKWDRALLNVGRNGEQAFHPEVRHCGRIIWDSHELADRLWARVAEAVPELRELQRQPDVTGASVARAGQIWTFTRLNERMRFLKYVGGEYFKGHCDGQYVTPDGEERSFMTLHLYLTDHDSATGNGLKGGATTFMNPRDERKTLDVKPKVGRVLLFQHRGLYHSGDDVLQGTKITVRTDLMYKLTGFGEPYEEDKSEKKPVISWKQLKQLRSKSASKKM